MASAFRPTGFQASYLAEQLFPIFVVDPIGHKVAMPLKLKLVIRLGLREAGFNVGGDSLEAIKSTGFDAY
jgi:hypothetical protein